MRYVRYLPVVLAILLLAWAISGCTNPRHFEPAIYSTRIEVGVGTGNQDRLGKRSWDSDSEWIALSWSPFAYWANERQAQVNALTLVEAAYARRNCHECDEDCEGCD